MWFNTDVLSNCQDECIEISVAKSGNCSTMLFTCGFGKRVFRSSRGSWIDKCAELRDY